jgi:probable rRNA maturation factor
MRRLVVARIRTALRALDRVRSSVTIVFTDDAEIRQLNRDFRRHARATDVLSFHLQELAGEGDPAGVGIHLGDIVISVETELRRSGPRRLGAALERLAVHGLCHLFGHDHQRPSQARRMYALERRLRRLPLPSPTTTPKRRTGKRPTTPRGHRKGARTRPAWARPHAGRAHAAKRPITRT